MATRRQNDAAGSCDVTLLWQRDVITPERGILFKMRRHYIITLEVQERRKSKEEHVSPVAGEQASKVLLPVPAPSASRSTANTIISTAAATEFEYLLIHALNHLAFHRGVK
ncbi:hypothetical protein FKM82_003957 [Ascaphus truei]